MLIRMLFKNEMIRIILYRYLNPFSKLSHIYPKNSRPSLIIKGLQVEEFPRKKRIEGKRANLTPIIFHK